MAYGSESRVFGRRAQQHVLILASGDKIRHVTLRPWMLAIAFCFAGVLLLGYLGATTYLVLRDDLIGASMARQARIQHEYEDRISGLRAQLDRITSRQLLDQQVVEQKVEKLLQQQNTLFSRNGKLGSLLDRAQESGVTAAPDSLGPSAVHQPNDDHASIGSGSAAAAAEVASSQGGLDLLAHEPLRENLADRADRIFSKVTLSLKDIERKQLAKVAGLTAGASETADAITSILHRTGIDIGDETRAAAVTSGQEGGVGGPFLPPRPTPSAFDSQLNDLDVALTRLESARETARTMPFANPAPGREVTSPYGNRVDPFLGRLAFHSGIDFQEATGDDVRSTGAGKVTIAGPVSGYGNMVEIDHGQGISTRYGHMSQVLVRVGDKVSTGDLIGKAGATGRATGPHLHYEVRRNGEPIDPVHFLNAGMKLDTYMN